MSSLPGELLIVLASIGLGFLHIIVQGHAITRERGPKWNMGARDEILPPPGAIAGRLDRALENFKETFPLFLGAVFVATASGRLGHLSLLGAHLYFWARLVYLPLYAFGVPVVRTLVWMVSAVGIGMILISALLGM